MTADEVRAEFAELRKEFALIHERLNAITSAFQSLRGVESYRKRATHETLDELRSAVLSFIMAHYAEHGIPFQKAKITRIFAHRLKQHDTNVGDLLAPLVPSPLHSLVTEKGATIYLPSAAWESADTSTRDNWYTRTEREYYKFKEEVRRMHQISRDTDADVERRANEQRLRDNAFIPSHGLPESEPVFGDLTDSVTDDTSESREQFGAEKKRLETT